jgi:hypothetical protein
MGLAPEPPAGPCAWLQVDAPAPSDLAVGPGSPPAAGTERRGPGTLTAPPGQSPFGSPISIAPLTFGNLSRQTDRTATQGLPATPVAQMCGPAAGAWQGSEYG